MNQYCHQINQATSNFGNNLFKTTDFPQQRAEERAAIIVSIEFFIL